MTMAAGLDPLWLDGLIVLVAALGAAGLGWPVTSAVLHVAASRSGRRVAPLAAPGRADDPPGVPGAGGGRAGAGTEPRPIDTPGLLRGGLWIGLLERLLIAGGIAVGQPAVIAVVVAVKGLGRLPELRESRAAGERFIIGTFASTAVAGACGLAAAALMART
ncbi:hypothetical protein BRM1_05190 [Brevibacterium sp. BRM-1]|uniref:hypothetical protein n=1 Tax=Brevibacterium sp. BRM-1 TaxID=2999062 RepID=UPI00227EDA45|nr:hypothetical protein [Brevibacterium sp. BRM-1]WAL41245.1 hypothetical protein BRM1_05190 [Brevibacterium sp. BRM-1]